MIVALDLKQMMITPSLVLVNYLTVITSVIQEQVSLATVSVLMEMGITC
jgi:hypothetical protein